MSWGRGVVEPTGFEVLGLAEEEGKNWGEVGRGGVTVMGMRNMGGGSGGNTPHTEKYGSNPQKHSRRTQQTVCAVD